VAQKLIAEQKRAAKKAAAAAAKLEAQRLAAEQRAAQAITMDLDSQSMDIFPVPEGSELPGGHHNTDTDSDSNMSDDESENSVEGSSKGRTNGAENGVMGKFEFICTCRLCDGDGLISSKTVYRAEVVRSIILVDL